jgi:hypothetical protein
LVWVGAVSLSDKYQTCRITVWMVNWPNIYWPLISQNVISFRCFNWIS